MSAPRTFRVLVDALPTPQKPALLDEAEAGHLTRVLRLSNGDAIECLDGKGGWAAATLEIRGKREALARFERTLEPGARAQKLPLALELAVLKGEAMEWAIEKATELGVSELFPVLTDYSVVQLGGKPPESFQERWQKITDQALKQCGRVHRMQVHPPRKLTEHIASRPLPAGAVRFWCDEGENLPAGASLHARLTATSAQELQILIGPEGGFSPAEREWLARESQTLAVGLGPWVLRAESAALTACALVAQRLLDSA